MNTPTVYLLSIGIDNYSSSIDNLSGCEKDVTDFRDTVINLGLVNEQNCVALHNEQATRSNIIFTIRQHFDQMKDGDIAVFHFSGHGAHENTPLEFTVAGLEMPSGRIESLVPHDRSSKIYSIADKEIRWLVHEIQLEKPNAQFISILDCCHAGSAMRDHTKINVKSTTNGDRLRPIESFLEGQFQTMLNYTNTIILPEINYISLAACSPKEEAREHNDGTGGFFTNAILDVIKSEKGKLTYTQIHSIVQNKVVKLSKGEQIPQLEYSGEGNPFHYFLTENISGHNMPVLQNLSGYWQTNVGSLNGINIKDQHLKKLYIYHAADPTIPIGTASVKEVKKEKTVVIPNWFDSYNTPKEFDLLFIGIGYTQIPITIHSYDNELDLDIIQNHFLSSDHADYKLDLHKDSIQIYNTSNNMESLIIGLNENKERANVWLKHQLTMIGKWEIIKNISTPKYSKINQDAIRIHLTFIRNFKTKIESSYTVALDPGMPLEQITISNYEEKENVPYQIKVKNEHTRNLFFILIHLDKTYQICKKYEDSTKSIPRNGNVVLYESIKHDLGFGISDPLANISEDHFLLFASETPFSSPYQFEQLGFKSNFGKIVAYSSPELMKSDESKAMPVDWTVKKLVVRIKRD